MSHHLGPHRSIIMEHASVHFARLSGTPSFRDCCTFWRSNVRPAGASCLLGSFGMKDLNTVVFQVRKLKFGDKEHQKTIRPNFMLWMHSTLSCQLIFHARLMLTEVEKASRHNNHFLQRSPRQLFVNARQHSGRTFGFAIVPGVQRSRKFAKGAFGKADEGAAEVTSASLCFFYLIHLDSNKQLCFRRTLTLLFGVSPSQVSFWIYISRQLSGANNDQD